MELEEESRIPTKCQKGYGATALIKEFPAIGRRARHDISMKKQARRETQTLRAGRSNAKPKIFAPP